MGPNPMMIAIASKRPEGQGEAEAEGPAGGDHLQLAEDVVGPDKADSLIALIEAVAYRCMEQGDE